MNRIEQKCVMASAGAHALLLLLILVGPAFVSSRTPPPESYPVINFIPFRTTDAASSGGSPAVVTPTPPAPTPAAPPKEIVKPETSPVREAKPIPLPKPTPVAPPKSTVPDIASAKPKSKVPDVSTNQPTIRSDASAARRRAEAAEAARAEQQRKQQLAGLFSNATRSLIAGQSGTTSVEAGVGGGGPSYANFNDALRSIYYRAWEPPPGIANEKAITEASVTVARDGTVLTAIVTVPSGDSATDASVRRTLERVKWIAPLPEGSEARRTVSVVFDLKAKRGD